MSNCVIVTTVSTICAAPTYAPTSASAAPDVGGSMSIQPTSLRSSPAVRPTVSGRPSSMRPEDPATTGSPSTSPPAQQTGLATAMQPGEVKGWMGLLVAVLALFAAF